MNLQAYLLPFIWALNGLLAVIYLIAEHLIGVSLIYPLTWLIIHTPKSQQGWMLAVAGMGLFCAIFSPIVVGIWLLLMALGSMVALHLEKFNPDNLRWRVVSGIGLYSLMGAGLVIYQHISPFLAGQNEVFAQGQGYLDILISIAIYIGPLGFLGLLAQAVFAHPPLEGTPDEIIYNVRTRGKR